MKDIVANRQRIPLASKFRLAWLVLRENGPLWSSLLLSYYLASLLAHHAFSRMARLRRARHLPGLNSGALNKAIWEAWDWAAGGDEWGESEAWKQSLIRNVLDREIPRECSILEIGPGAGRWTSALLDHARIYIGVDISSSCVTHCRERFARIGRASFVLGSGRDLTQIQGNSIDAIWSFDVFVHINKADVAAYAGEFLRVLRPGGIAVIHHGTVGGAQGGWRSDLTGDDFVAILTQNHFQIVKVLDRWTDGEQTYPMAYGDSITVFAAPIDRAE
ncbi:MAG TPA: class I SAM-dependent methyltransferase [Steroidobacteraceae bacterium]|jgi:SAM-dependent methyltransferase|nr:class I SAM-dependent methyltransferase [Steroidobacteraceae bacterium]